MSEEQTRPPRQSDAFVSHASQDTALAVRIERRLEAQGLEVWLDRSEIRLGVLLRSELQTAIRSSRVLILLWSGAAAASRWVAAELLTAFHLDRFVIPCVLDDTPLPHFLATSVYLDLRQDRARRIADLVRAVRAAPSGASEVPPLLSSRSAEQQETIQALVQGQAEVTDRLGRRDLEPAQEIQKLLDEVTTRALTVWGMDPMILDLAGYHYKNAYLLRHWDAIQAGQPPPDPLLLEAERFFFRSLFVDPNDYSALNGLGSVLVLERELDAAEFFIRQAIALAERDGVDYAAAQQDLAMILQRRQ